MLVVIWKKASALDLTMVVIEKVILEHKLASILGPVRECLGFRV